MAKPVEECRTVAELLEDPARYCVEAIAEAQDGEHIGLGDDPSACKWCVVGAARKVYPDDKKNWKAIYKFSEAIGGVVIGDFVRSHTHAEVLAAVRQAGI